MIRDLQAKVDVLTERSKNTEVIFQRLAFSSEVEFALRYTANNPEGTGLAGFVDLVSIWIFVSNEPGETLAWLNAAQKAKAVGLKGGSADATYAHLMTRHYPLAFIGSDKTPILRPLPLRCLSHTRHGAELSWATDKRKSSLLICNGQCRAIGHTAKHTYQKDLSGRQPSRQPK